ncbi:hypothetical protein KR222_005309 [Zaprionus bogoriensis]|nr:hypothetical protein KR222_005309 [Zaprionus bogoriensis]
MGAEQSAVLACTETGKPETPLRLHNAEQFFQLYFERMAEPQTGPVTAALLHLIMNMPQSQGSDQDSGYENEELEDSEEASDNEMEPMEGIDDLSDSGWSTTSTSTEGTSRRTDDSSDFELNPIEFVELQPVDLLGVDDPMLECQQEFIIEVADLTTEDI